MVNDYADKYIYIFDVRLPKKQENYFTLLPSDTQITLSFYNSSMPRLSFMDFIEISTDLDALHHDAKEVNGSLVLNASNSYWINRRDHVITDEEMKLFTNGFVNGYVLTSLGAYFPVMDNAELDGM